MKILHTSDWHLGKYLDKYSRINEQSKFIDELEVICENEKVDLIIIAGDIYDVSNPPIIAEKLFFNALKRLSLNGKRPIIIISGNHDSKSKLLSPSPLAQEFGIFIQGNLKTICEPIKNEYFSILNCGEGFLEIEVNGEKAVFITIPYITEKDLNEEIFKGVEDFEMQKDFSNKIEKILEDLSINFRDDTINVVVSHLFVRGGIESDSERKIQAVGGTYAIDSKVFPKNTQYVALGHLHRCQQIKASCKVYYSGSPIRYSQSEIEYDKVVLVVDIEPKKEAEVKKVVLKDYKPIRVFKGKNYDEAFEFCNSIKDEESYAFIEIIVKEYLSADKIRLLREIKKDIVSIIVKSDEKEVVVFDDEEKTIVEQFKDFYKLKRNLEPSDEILNVFFGILQDIEKEESDETL